MRYVWLSLILVACGDDSSVPAPGYSEAFRATLANPATEEHAEGERAFFEETWDGELDRGWPPADWMVDLWQNDLETWGEQFSNFGWIIDPGDDLPVGLKRGSADSSLVNETCATCHVAQLPDGRIWAGFPAFDLRWGEFRVAVNDAWVAEGNEPLLSETSRDKFTRLPQSGCNWVEPEEADTYVPMDFPLYLNLDLRGRLGSDGAARNARSVIIISMFSFRGGPDNPLEFPSTERAEPFVAYLAGLRTPEPLAENVDTAAAARGATVFEMARCSSCHHPDAMEMDAVATWDADGIERYPGDDPEFPHGSIATDGSRYLMTEFMGGVSEMYSGFIDFIVSQRLSIGMSDGYVAKDLHAVFASGPYLHNGSVPTLEALLMPAAERPVTFERNGRVVDTTTPGMSNVGHEFGTDLSEDDKADLLAYLRSL